MSPQILRERRCVFVFEKYIVAIIVESYVYPVGD
jgi:hypothetical protein